MAEPDTDFDTEQIAEQNRLNDDATGFRYLDIFDDTGRIALEWDVLETDLRRALYVIGRAFPHEEMLREAAGDYETGKIHTSENSIRYECEEYAVDVSEHYYNAFQDLLKNEFGDYDAATSDAEAYDEDFDELEVSKSVVAEHYRDRLRKALLQLMKQADESGSSYPVSYPVVVLKNGDTE
ncbi:hypothetical protein [Halorubellus salinus]|uniref:hypothetical protein n=1 Tax=Halorubellus salinus TaxID=755309 RepID=UPI001D06E66A|nr:hypothetical protein [Halorubellus salinus]